MRLTNEQKEQLYLMACYFCDWMEGENTQINWDSFNTDDINKIQKKLRMEVRGY